MNEKNIRISSTSSDVVQKLDRSKLQKKVEIPGDESASSIKSIIMLVIIIVLVAITGAYVVKNLQPTPPAPVTPENGADTTPTPLPTEEELKLIGELVMSDAADQYIVEKKVYTDTDTKFKGDPAKEYQLSNFFAQPYESFYRLEFDFSPGKKATEDKPESADPVEIETATTNTGSELKESVDVDDKDVMIPGIPSTTVNYRYRQTGREQIELVFSGMNQTATELANIMGADTTLEIFNSSIKDISYSAMDDEITVTVILNAYVKYYAQVKANKLVLDISEADKRSAEPIASPTISPSVAASASVIPSPTKLVTQVPAASSEYKLDVESKNITQAMKARISGYTYDDTPEEFIYQLKLAGREVPKVSSRMTAENKLEVKIEELSYDGLTKDGRAFTNFTDKSVKDILTMDVTFGGTTSTYIYSMTKKLNYKVTLEQVDGENRIMIRISH